MLNSSWRRVFNVLVIVSCRNNNRDAQGKELGEARGIRTDERSNPSHTPYLDHGVVDGFRGTTSKAQRGNGRSSSAFELRGDEVEAGDTAGRKRPRVSAFVPHDQKIRPSHVRVLTGTVITEDLDSNDVGGLGNTAKKRTAARKRPIKSIVGQRRRTIDLKLQFLHSGSHARFHPPPGIRRLGGDIRHSCS